MPTTAPSTATPRATFRCRVGRRSFSSSPTTAPCADSRPAPTTARTKSIARRGATKDGHVTFRFAAGDAKRATNYRIVEHSPDQLDRAIVNETRHARSSFHTRSAIASRGRRGPNRRDHVAVAPSVRPLRIFTLDPSVSYRLGGVATVNVPYEALEPGPKGRLFDVQCRKVPKPLDRGSARPRSAGAAAVERSLADAGERTVPSADGVFRLHAHLRRVPARARPRPRVGVRAGRG